VKAVKDVLVGVVDGVKQVGGAALPKEKTLEPEGSKESDTAE